MGASPYLGREILWRLAPTRRQPTSDTSQSTFRTYVPSKRFASSVGSTLRPEESWYLKAVACSRTQLSVHSTLFSTFLATGTNSSYISVPSL